MWTAMTMSTTTELSSAVGPYQLLRELGQGGMGTVWLARHETLNTKVAVKIIHGERALSERAVARFELEAHAMAALTSPNVARVWDYGRTDAGGYYYALEYIQGLDLRTMVKQYGPLPASRAVHFAEQVCDALGDAHDNGFIHRDLKPGNVVVSGNGGIVDIAKVLDFGLVRAMGCDRDAPTTPETISGTPAYLAPEITSSECRGECHVDGRADLYSLGCVLYWLLTGELLFNAPTLVAQMVAHASEPPRPISQIADQRIPSDLDALVLQCLSKQPDDRPASAKELTKLLRSTGLAEQWSQTDAKAWWAVHPAGSQDT